MGLIKALAGAAGGTLADQWKEFFYCDALEANVLVAKGQKRLSSQGRSSNTSAEDNIISNGSVIAVADGQCMAIVEQGKVVDICAEPGEYTYDKSTEPSVFTGGLGEGITNVFKTIGKRFTFGGDTGKDQRVYYFNTKEIPGNKYGTPTPIPFRVVDNNVGLDVDVSLRCFGEYSYKLDNPILFYTNVCGNVDDVYTRDKIDSQLKAELMSALQPAFAKISDMGIRYSALPAHTTEIADSLNEVLSKKWGDLRGLKIVSFGVSSVNVSDEDAQLIKDIQRNGAFRNPGMAAAQMVGATSDAMKAAANNQGGMGAMGAFMGMGMAQNMGGVNTAGLYQMQAQQAQQQQQAPQPAAGGWTCACGTTNNGKFCSNCGNPQPAPAAAWTCACGTQNTGKFCSNCGQPAPAGPWTCACGTQNTGKFCSNCGKPQA